MEEPSGDEGVGRGQHANEGILAGALSFFFARVEALCVPRGTSHLNSIKYGDTSQATDRERTTTAKPNQTKSTKHPQRQGSYLRWAA